jgi:hypothetical protein
MSTWIRKPESVRLPLSNGDWVEVRKYLTAGDTRRMYWRMMRRGAGGGEKMDPLLVSVSKIAAYVLAWTVTDADDRPIDLDGPEAEATILSVLDAMDPDRYRELAAAIDAHETAIDEEKKILRGAPSLETISRSPAISVGAMNG